MRLEWKGFLITWSLNTVCLVAVSSLMAGIRVDTWQAMLLAALALGLVNAVLRPLILLFTLPLNVASLGILTLFINGLLFYGVSTFVPGFSIAGFASAFWGAVLFSVISFLLNLFVNPQGRFTAQYYRSVSSGECSRRDAIDVEASPENRTPEDRGSKER